MIKIIMALVLSMFYVIIATIIVMITGAIDPNYEVGIDKVAFILAFMALGRTFYLEYR